LPRHAGIETTANSCSMVFVIPAVTDRWTSPALTEATVNLRNIIAPLRKSCDYLPNRGHHEPRAPEDTQRTVIVEWSSQPHLTTAKKPPSWKTNSLVGWTKLRRTFLFLVKR
jgi:hypothetical protein